MNKKVFLSFFIIVVIFIGSTIYSPKLQSPLISALNAIKNSYFNNIKSMSDSINKYFNQAKTIEILADKTKDYDILNIKLQQCKQELQNLYNENNSTFATNPKLELVHATAYKRFGDFTRLWMDIPDYNTTKIYGLLYKDYVAGIVINELNKPLALLNSDIKSTYSVYVGEEKAPGIAHGNDDNKLIVSFIPDWFNIKVGDEVTTSGLDNIFFQGLKVGKVIDIKQAQGYKNAIINPYFKSNKPNYFYIIRKIK